MMTVVQCWDDGVTTDGRLIDILRRYGAKATFNLSAGLHEKNRTLSFVHEGTEVRRLGRDEMREVYDGFTIANHSLTHPRLDQMPVEAARYEIVEGRSRLQQFFGQPVLGFAYPFGAYSESVMDLVREAGHVYARTDRGVDDPFPPENAMSFHPSCHFLAPDLRLRYEKAKERGVFYFWGHSYELTTEAMWGSFEETIRRISADPGSCWGELADLFKRGD
ncbi:MAG: polysaccharide deacetylase family protein [Syntrophaceae bacterium]|nr:polysaccharide deacetylase family protein [Syntrophaceae bacterium]